MENTAMIAINGGWPQVLVVCGLFPPVKGGLRGLYDPDKTLDSTTFCLSVFGYRSISLNLRHHIVVVVTSPFVFSRSQTIIITPSLKVSFEITVAVHLHWDRSFLIRFRVLLAIPLIALFP